MSWLSLQATEDKNNAIAQAEKTATKAKLADRLINGLSGENKRWNETIAKFGVAEGTCCLKVNIIDLVCFTLCASHWYSSHPVVLQNNGVLYEKAMLMSCSQPVFCR